MPTNPFQKKSVFPAPQKARDDLNGLVAASQIINVDLLLDAYTHGIFPWEVNHHGVFWFSPDKRMVLNPCDFKISKSFAKTLKKNVFEVRADCDFHAIIRCCAKRRNGESTWIVAEIIQAYEELFALNIAHSLGVYLNGALVGGLYGVQIGEVFSGESMFFLKPNASKIAVLTLCQNAQKFGFSLIDCQVPSEHFLKWGGKITTRSNFLEMIKPLTKNIAPQQWML